MTEKERLLTLLLPELQKLKEGQSEKSNFERGMLRMKLEDAIGWLLEMAEDSFEDKSNSEGESNDD